MSFRKIEVTPKDEMNKNLEKDNEEVSIIDVSNNVDDSNEANNVTKDEIKDDSINPQINENLIKIIEDIVAKCLQKHNTYKRPINYAKELKLLSQKTTKSKPKKISKVKKSKSKSRPKVIPKITPKFEVKIDPKFKTKLIRPWIYVRR